MYHAETDTPAMARTSNLNEELGQVSYPIQTPLCCKGLGVPIGQLPCDIQAVTENTL